MDQVIIWCASYVFIVVVILWAVALAWTDKPTRFKFVAVTAAAGVIALILSRIAGHLYYDPRPFVTEHVMPLIQHVADNGFPSDHALSTATLAAVTYFFKRNVAYFMIVLAVVIGAARVLAHVHSPIDIAGAWAIGSISAVVSYYVVQKIYGRTRGNLD